MKVYFDNAATTQLDKEALDAMMPYLTNNFGNPSAVHSYGRACRAAIELSRKTIASHLNCHSLEIYFVGTGTEANNTAIKCAVRDLGIKHIITSAIEHKCVLNSSEESKRMFDVQVHKVSVDKQGRFDLEHLNELLEKTGSQTLVSLMHANNELGTAIDLKKVAALVKSHGAFMHSDTVQTIAHFPIDLQEIDIDFISGSAHKFHGPKGIGFLYIKNKTKIKSLIHGGGQENSLRAGTENVSGIVGMAKAMDLSINHMEEHTNYIKGLKSYMIQKLKEEIPDIDFNGDISDRSLYTVLNVSFPPEYNAATLVFNLDINGIAVSAGSACSSGAVGNSYVLEALGAPSERKAVRFSFSKNNTKDEIDFVVSKLKELQPATA